MFVSASARPNQTRHQESSENLERECELVWRVDLRWLVEEREVLGVRSGHRRT